MTATARTSAPAASTPAPPSRLPSVARLSWVRAGLEIVQFWRAKDAVIFTFAFPVILLAIFGSVFDGTDQGRDGVTVDFAHYFLPGVIAAGLMLTSFQALAISVALEREDGTLRRLRGTPLPASAYLGGKVLLTMATSALQTAVLLAVAAVVFDVPLPTEPDRWVTFAWVYLLGSATGSVCGVAFASVPRSGRHAATVIAPVVLLLQFISGVFFPYFMLPGWMQTLATVFPLKWIAEGMRSVFLPEHMAVLEVGGTWQPVLTAAVLGAWLIGALVLGVRTFRWRRHDDG